MPSFKSIKNEIKANLNKEEVQIFFENESEIVLRSVKPFSIELKSSVKYAGVRRAKKGAQNYYWLTYSK